ncbi:MAG: hypothetical protein JG764_882 [Clostridiales bacterium]|nr:hypothetical protein [Clostridiales bacterium]
MWEEKGGAEIIKYNRLKDKRSSLAICVIFFVIVCILLIFSANLLISQLNETGNYFYKVMRLVSVLTDSGKNILNEGLPLLNSNLASSKVTLKTPEDIVQYFLYILTRVDVADSKTFLSACINIMDTVNVNNANSYDSLDLTEIETKYYQNIEDNKVRPENNNAKTHKEIKFPLSSKPLVAIYNTHNAETFIPTDGTSKIEGKNAGVAKVAKTLAETLEKKYGIKTVRSDTIHDYPHWEKSYANSAKTVKKLLAMYPSLKVIIDVHRDAGLPEKSVTALADGNKGATIMLVVGTDKRLSHPNWRKNWEFAKKVGKKMDELYPGLLKEVRVQSGRYNQHLHERAILAEIGSSKNSLEEAQVAARAFAHVLSEVLKDQPAFR